MLQLSTVVTSINMSCLWTALKKYIGGICGGEFLDRASLLTVFPVTDGNMSRTLDRKFWKIKHC